MFAPGGGTTLLFVIFVESNDSMLSESALKSKFHFWRASEASSKLFAIDEFVRFRASAFEMFDAFLSSYGTESKLLNGFRHSKFKLVFNCDWEFEAPVSVASLCVKLLLSMGLASFDFSLFVVGLSATISSMTSSNASRFFCERYFFS